MSKLFREYAAAVLVKLWFYLFVFMCKTLVLYTLMTQTSTQQPFKMFIQGRKLLFYCGGKVEADRNRWVPNWSGSLLTCSEAETVALRSHKARNQAPPHPLVLLAKSRDADGIMIMLFDPVDTQQLSQSCQILLFDITSVYTKYIKTSVLKAVWVWESQHK